MYCVPRKRQPELTTVHLGPGYGHNLLSYCIRVYISSASASLVCGDDSDDDEVVMCIG